VAVGGRRRRSVSSVHTPWALPRLVQHLADLLSSFILIDAVDGRRPLRGGASSVYRTIRLSSRRRAGPLLIGPDALDDKARRNPTPMRSIASHLPAPTSETCSRRITLRSSFRIVTLAHERTPRDLGPH
jgi:hypothetical protein